MQLAGVHEARSVRSTLAGVHEVFLLVALDHTPLALDHH
jgi:hypothetical protein